LSDNRGLLAQLYLLPANSESYTYMYYSTMSV